MATLEPTIIELNKPRILLLIFGSIALVATGFWLLSVDAAFLETARGLQSSVFIRIVGGVSVVTFSLSGLFWIRRLLNPAPGLLLDSEGLIDNSSAVAAGKVPWHAVDGIAKRQLSKQIFVAIDVADPEKYLPGGNTMLVRVLSRINRKLYGSAINISAITLKVEPDELYAAVKKYYDASHNSV